MRVPHRRRRLISEMNLTPMIDVVFQLIIFFLLASQLTRQEALVDVDLPEAVTASEPAPVAPGRVAIQITTDGQVFVEDTLLSPPELANYLTRSRAASNQPLEVRLRGDRAVPFRFVEPVLRACAESGVTKISLGALRAPSTSEVP